ncbi:MAG: tetratricopeptide repeat protein [Cyclobacteriaceae bacterium]|nr:tetratricopeptide repeat protein [Cyclobacteriaceae bacterium]
MKYFFTSVFLCCGLLLTGVTFARQNLDSLESVLRNTTTDSVRLRLMIELSKKYQYKNFARAKQFSDQALALAEDKNWVWGKVSAYSQEGFLATISGDYTSAIKYDNLNLQLVISKRDSAAIAETLNYLGNDYSDLGKYDEAYYYFTQSYRVARAINDTLAMAVAMFNTGTVLTELGQYDLALDHFSVAIKLSEASNDLDGLPYNQDAVGDVFLRKKDYGKAEENLTKALKNTKARKITVLEPRILKHLAKLYFETKQFDKALAMYDSATRIYEHNSNEFGVAEVNLGKSEILMEQGKFAEAQKKIESSLATAKSFNADKMSIDCYKLLSNLAERKGDFKVSLEYYKNYKQLEDSLFSIDMLEKIFQDQLRFKTETKDYEIATLSKARSDQQGEIKREEFLRNILVVVVALTAIMLFTVYRSGQRRIQINKLLMEHQEEIKKRKDELEQLNQVKDKFFSIISHDLRSPMNALSGVLNLMERDNVSREEFSNLTKELRTQFNHTRTLINNLLDWALFQMDKLKIQPEKIELSGLVNENFNLLSSMHLKEMKLVNKVPANTYGWGDLNMVNLVLRNLILNAIKFSKAGGDIEISATEKDGFITMAIRDFGVGIQPEVQKILFEKTMGYSTRGTANEKGTGLGLILCKEFVEKNGGTIWLESEAGKGSTFYFTLPKA